MCLLACLVMVVNHGNKHTARECHTHRTQLHTNHWESHFIIHHWSLIFIFFSFFLFFFLSFVFLTSSLNPVAEPESLRLLGYLHTNIQSVSHPEVMNSKLIKFNTHMFWWNVSQQLRRNGTVPAILDLPLKEDDLMGRMTK